MTKLRNDFELDREAGPFCELTSLTTKPSARRGLADLVTMVSGKEMDKDLGGGALTDWTATVLSKEQQLYAANDAWAHLFVWEELERRRAGPGERETSLPAMPDGAGASGGEAPVPWSVDVADVLIEGDGTQTELVLSDELRAEVGVGVSNAEWLECGDDDDTIPVNEEPPPTPPEVTDLFLCRFFFVKG